ncbi:MAG: (Fe-S)-binding protein [Firmicutes bacterium]|jgi:Fe-S oxidoreductase|nr:(Fe-S)-binding protein [Bacillota bacterium]
MRGDTVSDVARLIVEDCRFCPMCRDVCTSGVVTGLESNTSRGYALLADRWYTRGVLPEGGADAFYACMQCGLCKATCVSDRDLPDAILTLRSEFVERHMQPRNVREARAKVMSAQTALNGASGISPYRPELGGITFAAGGLLTPEGIGPLVKALRALAEKHDQPFSVLESEIVCEHMLFDLGYRDDAVAAAGRFLKRLQESGVKTLITACSQCYDMYVRRYPQWGITWPEDVEIIHLVMWLEKLSLTPLPDAAATGRIWLYHDDASLARWSVMHDTPRAVLDRLLPGRWLEFPLNRERAYACGATGAMPLVRKDIAMGAAERLFDAALETAAAHEATPCIVTACARCSDHLDAARKALAAPVEVRHLAELAAGMMTTDAEGVAP